MLRIFGAYNFNKFQNDATGTITDVFEIRSKYTRFLRFNQRDIFISFEMVNSDKVKNFYWMNKKQEKACFVVGNIYTYRLTEPEVISGTNIAEKVISLYERNGTGFVRYLRGEFNIILIDKNKVFLINDELGLSPMYIMQDKVFLLFCTQAEPLIWIKKNHRLDYLSIGKFLFYGFVPDGKTFICGLSNQEPGTVVSFDGKELAVKKYGSLPKENMMQKSQHKIVECAKKIFTEAVAIRAAHMNSLFLELTGGWDTRFILATLTELQKPVFAITRRNKKIENYIIAAMVTKHFGLTHIVSDDSKCSPFFEFCFNFKFSCQQSIYDSLNNRLFNKDIRELEAMGFFTSPIFAGTYGTELFGYVPDLFKKRIGFDFDKTVSWMFDHRFKGIFLNRKASHGKNKSDNTNVSLVYCFLHQMGRSYLNTHYTFGWERPAVFFSYLRVRPFTDSRFVAFLSSLEYDKHMYYKLYSQVYETYYADWLTIPFTYTPFRKQYALKNINIPTYRYTFLKQQKELLALAKKEKGFRRFILNNHIVNKTGIVISQRIKELYFLYSWFNAYSTRIDASERKILISEG